MIHFANLVFFVNNFELLSNDNPVSYVDPNGTDVGWAQSGNRQPYGLDHYTLSDYLMMGLALLGPVAKLAGIRIGVSEGAAEGGSVGAAKRLIYEASPKHGPTAKGSISAAPRNGQEALDLSTQVKPTSPRRVGIDYESGQFNVFDQTSAGIFHGHVRTWNELTSEMQRALRQTGMVDSRGRILGGQ